MTAAGGKKEYLQPRRRATQKIVFGAEICDKSVDFYGISCYNIYVLQDRRKNRERKKDCAKNE